MPVDLHPVTDLNDLTTYWQVESAVQEHDFVALPADPLEDMVSLLDDRPQAGERVLLHLAVDQGRPVAVMRLELPVLDNLVLANVELLVHPDHRRRGLGRQLLTASLGLVREHGRSRVLLEAPAPLSGGEGAAGPLLRSVGARPVLDEARRLLDLTRHPVTEPVPAPAGYRVVRWRDTCPDDVVEGAAYLMGRMTVDAPMGEMDYEPERWDVARYRDKEATAIARGRTRFATAAVHEASGTVAGITDIGVSNRRPEVVYQWDTIVDPPHRGHGLGMVLKSQNHAQLVAAVPQVRWVNTWNALSNTHMLRVNDALGFEPAERWLEWQLEL